MQQTQTEGEIDKNAGQTACIGFAVRFCEFYLEGDSVLSIKLKKESGRERLERDKEIGSGCFETAHTLDS